MQRPVFFALDLNAPATSENIYVPTFSMDQDAQVLQIIRQHTSKNVIEVEANGVWEMGGSVRCLTWQLTGANAEKIILGARND